MTNQVLHRLDEEGMPDFPSLHDIRFGKMGHALPVEPVRQLTRDELRARLEQMSRRGQTDEQARPSALPTGFAEFDALLPGGGWPVGAITELMPEAQGIGELSLLLPALAQLTRAGRYLLWIAPPCLPYPPEIGRAHV